MGEAVKIKTTTEQIVEHLKRAIFSGRYLPGEKIRESDLSEWLGVSRTPIREALRVLELEGLIEIDPNKGARIPSITQKDIDDVCEYRILLETHCLRKFIERLDEDDIRAMEAINEKMKEAALRKDYFSYYEESINFHGYYVKKHQNKRIYIGFSIVRNIIRCAQIFFQKNPSFYEAAIQEHEKLMEALRTRDPDKCVTLLQEHLSENCMRMKESMGRNGGLISLRQDKENIHLMKQQ